MGKQKKIHEIHIYTYIIFNYSYSISRASAKWNTKQGVKNDKPIYFISPKIKKYLKFLAVKRGNKIILLFKMYFKQITSITFDSKTRFYNLNNTLYNCSNIV